MGISHNLDPKQRAMDRRMHRREMAREVTTRTGLALMSYVRDHGQWPAHPAAMVAHGYLRVDDWKLPDERVRFSEIPVGPTTLARLTDLPFKKRDRALAEAEQALPEHAVAMRLGDLVFTYFGAPCTDGVNGLWLAVLLPHPELDGRERILCVTTPECGHVSPCGYYSGCTQEFDV